jgi:hypothetical protein
MTQRDFGSKPFPTQLGNGTPDFIFPVANTFKYAGNNVLDASQDFPIVPLSTTSVPNAGVPEGQVPSVGVILYGGPGNNTIYGSQAPDFIAGGSGNTTIWGGRGDNQLLGSDGVNVDVITRGISFPHDAEHRRAGQWRGRHGSVRRLQQRDLRGGRDRHPGHPGGHRRRPGRRAGRAPGQRADPGLEPLDRPGDTHLPDLDRVLPAG